jgi:integrase
MSKRVKGEGFLGRRGPRFAGTGTAWVGQVMIRGQRRSFYGPTSTAVKRKIQEARAALEGGDGLAVVRGTLQQPAAPTLAEYLPQWLDARRKEVEREEVEASTVGNDEINVRRHIIPALGHHPLDRLMAAMVDDMIDAARARDGVKLSPSFRKQIRSTLRHALHDAQALGLVDRNVAALSRPIRQRKSEVKPFSLDDARRIVAAAQDHDEGAIFLTATFLGMREGEVLGTLWENVDLDNAVIQVRTHLKREKDSAGVGRFVLGDLKTHLKAHRSLEIPHQLVEVLRRHRERQDAIRARVGDAWSDQWHLVFTTEFGTPIEKTNFIRRRWRPFLAGIGVPYRKFHTTRHTAASVAKAAGVDPTYISRMLGHSEQRTTDQIYTHLFEKVLPTQSVADVLSG